MHAFIHIAYDMPGIPSTGCGGFTETYIIILLLREYPAVACSQGVPQGSEAQEHPSKCRLQAQSVRLWAGSAVVQ